MFNFDINNLLIFDVPLHFQVSSSFHIQKYIHRRNKFIRVK